MYKRENQDSRLIFIKNSRPRWGNVLWLIPVLAFVLVLLITLYGRKYRKTSGGVDSSFRIVRTEVEALLRPLQLTAMHFETLSKEFLIPRETLHRHFKLLKQLAPYRTLSVLNKNQGNVLSVGKDLDTMRAQSQVEHLGEKILITPVFSKKRVSGLEITIPISPIKGEPHWLVATVDMASFLKKLPPSVRFRRASKGAEIIHPRAPELTLKIREIARPLWPLLLGELMMALGIAVLLWAAKNNS